MPLYYRGSPAWRARTRLRAAGCVCAIVGGTAMGSVLGTVSTVREAQKILAANAASTKIEPEATKVPKLDSVQIPEFLGFEGKFESKAGDAGTADDITKIPAELQYNEYSASGAFLLGLGLCLLGFSVVVG